jgi:hypothetical protein
MRNLIVAAVVGILAPAVSLAQTGAPSAPTGTAQTGTNTPAGAADTKTSTPDAAAAVPSAQPAPANAQPAAPNSPQAATPGAPSGPANGQAAAPPIRPGAVRITTRPPELDKWDFQKSANGAQRVYKCKPLACADAETITFIIQKSPTSHPDPQALEKLAKVDLPKSVRAVDAMREVLTNGAQKIDTLTSKTGTLKNYPAVLNETRFSQANVVVFANIAIVFAGPAMIRIQSVSPNRDLAQKTLNQFVDAMKIEEGPPLQPGVPQPVSGAEQL